MWTNKKEFVQMVTVGRWQVWSWKEFQDDEHYIYKYSYFGGIFSKEHLDEINDNAMKLATY